MIRRIALAALLAAAAAGPSLAEEGEVAGRPALTTKSAQDLIKQRDVWGTQPALSSAQAATQPSGPMVAGRPALSTKSTAELLAERDQWGKGKSTFAKARDRAKVATENVKRRAKVAYRAGKRQVNKAIAKVRGKKS